jgi:hypothetical protein
MHGGVGSSEDDRADVAGREAVEAALAQVDGVPALAVVFCSHAYDLDLLAATVQSAVGDAPVVGATSAGLLLASGNEPGRFVGTPSHVGVLVLAGDDVEIGAALVQGITADGVEAGRTVARAARAALPSAAPGSIPVQGNRSTLLLLSDGLAGDQQNLVRGIHAVAGARVPVVGGAAADGYSLAGPSVLFGGHAYRDAAVAIWLRSRRALPIGFAHGWTPAGLPALVTATSGNRVLEIGGRPAQDFYTSQLQQLGEQRVGERFYELAVRRPLGMVQSDGSHLIRSVLGAGRKGLQLSASVPEGASVQLMVGDRDTLLSSAGDLGARLRTPPSEAGVAGPGVLLFFSCAARRLALGDRVMEEPARLSDGSLTTLGLYTYGEFCRSSNVQGYHNATVAGLAL